MKGIDNMTSNEIRCKEVKDWFDNLISSYLNYMEFSTFPGNCEASITQDTTRLTELRVYNLKSLCEYGNIPYTYNHIGNYDVYNVYYKEFKFFDIVEL